MEPGVGPFAKHKIDDGRKCLDISFCQSTSIFGASEDKLMLAVLGECVAVNVVEEGLWWKEFSSFVVPGFAFFVQAALLSSDRVTGGKEWTSGV